MSTLFISDAIFIRTRPVTSRSELLPTESRVMVSEIVVDYVGLPFIITDAFSNFYHHV